LLVNNSLNWIDVFKITEKKENEKFRESFLGDFKGKLTRLTINNLFVSLKNLDP